jgi:hypothetical protein
MAGTANTEVSTQQSLAGATRFWPEHSVPTNWQKWQSAVRKALGAGATNLVSRAMSLRARQLQGPDISLRFGASIAPAESWNVSATRVAPRGPILSSAAETIP